ncbi:MAG: response regulator [Actinomycetota bacterium]|nr:response regulator [Actinomycetota bacterium]
MSRFLVVADEPWVRNEVHAALSIGANELIDHGDPATAATTAGEESVDAAIVDLQVASMGGMAVTRDIRDGANPVPVIILLDREADAFLAGRSGASAWITKPFTASALRATVASVTGVA